MRRLTTTIISSIVISTGLSLSAYAEDFTLKTNAFLDKGILPVLYTCDSQDISPQISWTNPPEKTQTFAVVMSDPDAPSGTFYHWIVYNIPNTAKELLQGPNKPPEGSVFGKNGWGKAEYNGPCPPKGSAHNYIVTIYALDDKLKIEGEPDYSKIEDGMHGHILGSAKLTAVYSRWAK